MPSTGLPWEVSLAGIGGGSCLLMEPNGVDSRPAAASLQGEQIDSTSGAGFLDKDGGRPAMRYEFEYVTESREETAFLRDYFDARAGKAIPFWFPTWTKELNVASYFDALDLFGGIWLVSEGYASTVWPLGAAYRRIIVTYGNQWTASRIIGVALNTPMAGIERIQPTDGSGPGVGGISARPYTEVRGFTVLALRFGRFDTDVLAMAPNGDGCATITLPILELPDEATE